MIRRSDVSQRWCRAWRRKSIDSSGQGGSSSDDSNYCPWQAQQDHSHLFWVSQSRGGYCRWISVIFFVDMVMRNEDVRMRIKVKKIKNHYGTTYLYTLPTTMLYNCQVAKAKRKEKRESLGTSKLGSTNHYVVPMVRQRFLFPSQKQTQPSFLLPTHPLSCCCSLLLIVFLRVDSFVNSSTSPCYCRV